MLCVGKPLLYCCIENLCCIMLSFIVFNQHHIFNFIFIVNKKSQFQLIIFLMLFYFILFYFIVVLFFLSYCSYCIVLMQTLIVQMNKKLSNKKQKRVGTILNKSQIQANHQSCVSACCSLFVSVRT